MDALRLALALASIDPQYKLFNILTRYLFSNSTAEGEKCGN